MPTLPPLQGPDLPGGNGFVRVVSDGTPLFTHVLLPDGKELEGVTHISLRVDASDPFVVLDLRVGPTHLDINAVIQRVTFHCPGCQRDITHKCEQL